VLGGYSNFIEIFWAGRLNCFLKDHDCVCKGERRRFCFFFSLGGLGLGCTYIPYFSLVRRGEVRWGGVGSRKEEGRIET
jgi:hypothetical protein